ncbi:substrate-binding domain-containing protein [Dendronalium sp. ChiSLP03b]|uniref:substrate-binding domain-containing protein n=1 Tax=Dendronalium sp. ChiSLP03b TaxID=3075381 RepID=UPI002AD1DBD0|nr:substrate-binding domain-containing protein [Dendronalium sp. ChiSLP03b]MDZ8207699.1 substrate-binding domain-containing protein [Dendronalium sp. ChiSLP03b]
MSQKNETTLLVLAFLITVGLVGGGVWWFVKSSGFTTSPLKSSNNSPESQASTPQTFAQVQNVPSGLISYGGSTTWAPVRKEIDPIIQNVWPQFQLRYANPEKEAPSSATGISMLLKSQLDFAQSSRPVANNEYEAAQKRGIQIREIPVAIDGLVAVVHPSLNIPGLTVDQYENIFAGKITNWREVGGPDLKIQLYGKKDRDGGDRFKLTQTTTEALRKVAADPAGIYWSSATLLVPQCGVKSLPIGRDSSKLIPPYKLPLVPTTECPGKRNQVNTDAFRSGEYPLSRRLVVVVKENAKFERQAGEAYANLLLTNQGQQLLNKAGFVRIR